MHLGFNYRDFIQTGAKSSSWGSAALKFTWRARYAVLILLIGGICLASANAAESRTIRLIVSEDSAFARETAARLRSLLEQSQPDISLEQASANVISTAPARLLVTVGDAAWKAAMAEPARDTPVLGLILRRNAYEAEAKRTSRNLSAIFLEQPVGRMFNLVTLIKPRDARVGVVLGPDSQAMAALLQTSSGERRQYLRLESATEESTVGKVLANVVRDVNVLLAIPDPVAQTANTVRPILLMSYHAGVPVIGYSAAYQRAGAMVSLYSTPEQVARQAAEVVNAWREGQGLPAAQEPKYFTVGVNTTVARSLGIDLPNADVLGQKLRAMKE